MQQCWLLLLLFIVLLLCDSVMLRDGVIMHTISGRCTVLLIGALQYLEQPLHTNNTRVHVQGNSFGQYVKLQPSQAHCQALTC